MREALRVTRGKVINVSSTMGSIADNTSGRAYAYRMSKAALNMATKNMALELGPACILVNGVVTHARGKPTGAAPGRLLRVTTDRRRPFAAAAE